MNSSIRADVRLMAYLDAMTHNEDGTQIPIFDTDGIKHTWLDYRPTPHGDPDLDAYIASLPTPIAGPVELTLENGFLQKLS